MGKIPAILALSALTFASNLPTTPVKKNSGPPAAAVAPERTPESEGRDAAKRLLGWDDRVAFRAEYSRDGRAAELVIQFRRDPLDGTYGASARVLELRRRPEGVGFRRPGAHENQLSRYQPARDVLSLVQWHPDRFGEHAFGMVVEFPMRNEPSVGGRLLGWNVVTQSYEPEGTVRWTRLSHAEETELENRAFRLK